MRFRIDVDNGISIYEQIVRQTKYQIAEGILVGGQLVPSVRELARELALNPNTIQRAYLQLQQEEILQPIRGRGMMVAENAQRRCKSDRGELLQERLDHVAYEGIRSGLNPDQLRQMFDRSLNRAEKLRENP